MAKLAPPIIENTVPAFYTNTTETGSKGNTVISVPFALNKSVASSQVFCYQLKIKNISSTTYLQTIDGQADWEKKVINFSITDISNLKVGQYYKIQVACVEKNSSNNRGEVGYFSDTSIIKYTSKPILEISDLTKNEINKYKHNYTGVYTQQPNNDTTERVYKYRFIVYDDNYNPIIDTGYQIHNSLNDTVFNSSNDSFECKYDLEEGIVHYIEYRVITINGLEFSTGKYRLRKKGSIEPNLNAYINPILNYENGYISVCLDPYLDKNGKELGSTGSFELLRTSSESNYKNWEVLSHIGFHSEIASGEIFKDFTIHQGKTYIYGMAQYSDDGIYSNKKLSREVYADFEDLFLYDGEKQLKIKFNPQVSSFKADLLEQKIDTIGSKYPFIFRNGNVNYKEISISGLISYLSDEEGLFLTNKDLGLERDIQIRGKTKSVGINSKKTRTTSLVSYNIKAERDFKLTVLEWLNDGKVKLFKSPTEGNYLVRLMNSSLSPNTTVGRMLHTFTSQAYEIDECNYGNMVKYKIINDTYNEKVSLKWAFVNVQDLLAQEDNIMDGYIKVNVNAATSLTLDGLTPGDIIYLDGQEIVIGVTGSYHVKDFVNIKEILLPVDQLKNNINAINIIYSYYDRDINIFDNINEIEQYTIPTRRFMDKCDIIQQLTYCDGDTKYKDIKNQLSSIKRLTFTLKEGIGQKLYTSKKDNHKYFVKHPNDLNGFTEEDQKYVFDYHLYNPYYLYPVYEVDNSGNEKFIGHLTWKETNDGADFVLDTTSKENISQVTIISANGKTKQVLDLAEINSFTTEFITDIPQSIQIESGVFADIVYTSNIVTYKQETLRDINNYKQEWLAAQSEYNDVRTGLNKYSNDESYKAELLSKKKKIISTYKTFISYLIAELEKEE